jgi:hypothetical protein
MERAFAGKRGSEQPKASHRWALEMARELKKLDNDEASDFGATVA